MTRQPVRRSHGPGRRKLAKWMRTSRRGNLTVLRAQRRRVRGIRVRRHAHNAAVLIDHWQATKTFEVSTSFALTPQPCPSPLPLVAFSGSQALLILVIAAIWPLLSRNGCQKIIPLWGGGLIMRNVLVALL